MACDELVQPIRKYYSIRRMKYQEFQIGIFGRIKRAPWKPHYLRGTEIDSLIISCRFPFIIPRWVNPRTVLVDPPEKNNFPFSWKCEWWDQSKGTQVRISLSSSELLHVKTLKYSVNVGIVTDETAFSGHNIILLFKTRSGIIKYYVNVIRSVVTECYAKYRLVCSQSSN